MLANISEVIEEIAEYLGEYFLQESIDPELFAVYSTVSAGYLYLKMDLKYPQSKSYMSDNEIFSQKHIIARVSEEEILRLYEQESLNDFLYDNVEPNLPRIDGSPAPFNENPYIILNGIQYYPDKWIELRTKLRSISTPNTIMTATWPMTTDCSAIPFPLHDDSFFKTSADDHRSRLLVFKKYKDRNTLHKSNYYMNSKKYDEQIEYPLIAPFIFDEYNALNVKEEAEIARFIETVPRP